MKKILLLATFAFTPVAAHAAPILDCVIFQDGGRTQITLNDNDPLVSPTLSWGNDMMLVYGVAVVGVPSGNLSTKIYINDQLRASLSRSLIQDVSGDGRVVYMLSAPLTECCYHPQTARIDVDLTGIASQSFNFRVVQPIPEPASALLFATGALGLLRRRR